MLGPICLPIFTYLPYHVHKHLVNSLSLSIGLSMVRWSSDLPYVHEFTQLFDDVTSKLAPWSLRSLAGALKIEMYPCHRNLATVFTVWSGVMMCFVKWLQKTRSLTIIGGWYSSIVISRLIKSMCNSSKGAVAMVSCIGALAWVPPCWMHHSQ